MRVQPVVLIGVYDIVRQHVRTVRYWNILQRYTANAVSRICVFPKSCIVATNPREESMVDTQVLETALGVYWRVF
jgi:hypothetical protein